MLFFILGAADPEMIQIERLLIRCEVPYGFALDARGTRVHSENAYRAQGVSESKDGNARSVWVECGPEDERIRRQIVIDHHRPGDPGYGRHPSQFLPASSLGQSIAVLAAHGMLPPAWRAFERNAIPFVKGSWHYVVRDSLWCNWLYQAGRWYCLGCDGFFHEIPTNLVLAAAADHCLGHAYRQRCPGVTVEALREWRAKSRAKWQGIPLEQLYRDIEDAVDQLRQLPTVEVGGYEYRLAETRFKELPEASALLGEPVIYSQIDRRSGRLKVAVRNGCVQQMKSWMSWARSHMKDVYGDPARGFAGGYLT